MTASGSAVTVVPAPAHFRRSHGVPALTVALAVSSVLLTVAMAGGGVSGAFPLSLGWLVIAALYALTEVLVVHLEVGRETHSFSLTEIPLIMGLFLATPGNLVLGHALGAGLALAVHRRQSGRKLAFNMASFAFSTSCAVVVFGVLVDPVDPLGPRGWLAAFTAALTADLVSAVAVQAVIAVSTGERFAWTGPSASGVRFCLVNACLGLAATILLISRPETTWLVVVLSVALYGAYRVSVRERHKQVRLMGLQEATGDIQEELGDGLEARLLGRAREMFGAERAELVSPQTDGSARRVTLGPGNAISSQVLDPSDATGGIHSRVIADDAGVRLMSTDAHGTLRRQMDARGIRHAMAAPVRAGDVVVASIAVLDREGNVGGWPEEELPLLETLANHVGVAMRNRDLVAGLATRAAENEWMARHDPLTGLPNRTWFLRLAERSMADATDRDIALLALVLDGFQEIRDTLGHIHADALLRAVADRLRTGDAPLGRLEGDGFVLLDVGDAVHVTRPGTSAAGGPPVDADAPTDPEAATAAERRASSLLSALETPFTIDGMQLLLTATVGIAHAGRDGDEPGGLLRMAERAVVQAHAMGRAVARYRPDQDAHNPIRLALVGELREALEAGDVGVWYQAKVDPATGRLLGAEALARWIHPRRGQIPPDAFIPIAERTSVLRPLTLHVLQTAAWRGIAWQAMGARLGVAVNLSPRNLLDAQLLEDVAAILTRTGLPAAALTLEVTESAVMADPARSLAVLGGLRAQGVQLSIDDYGAGQASLAYLRELPVHELKIDRSFVGRIETEAAARAIVRSTIDLAHDLGLRVVAEGVETPWQLDWLARHECDAVQGYHLGRPEPAAVFDARVSLIGTRSVGPAVEVPESVA